MSSGDEIVHLDSSLCKGTVPLLAKGHAEMAGQKWVYTDMSGGLAEFFLHQQNCPS